MLPSCVNGGGPASILRFAQIPLVEQEAELEAQACDVLRCWQARPGEVLTVVDPAGAAYRVRLTGTAMPPRGIPFRKLAGVPESPLMLEVYQALPEKERFELILQKLTELGVSRIVPVHTARSTTRQARDAVQPKSRRWPEVVLRAAKQCRRARLPELFATVGFAEALELAAGAALKLILYEGENVRPFAAAFEFAHPERVAVLIGPEGGFTEDEISIASKAGFLPTGLGLRILRTETAAIATAALLQSRFGDLS